MSKKLTSLIEEQKAMVAENKRRLAELIQADRKARLHHGPECPKCGTTERYKPTPDRKNGRCRKCDLEWRKRNYDAKSALKAVQ